MDLVHFYSRHRGRTIIFNGADGKTTEVNFRATGRASVEGSGKVGISDPALVEQLRALASGHPDVWELTEEMISPSVIPSLSTNETKVKMDDGSYRVVTDEQLKAMVQLSDEALSGIDQDEPTVPGGAELKARRKESGLSLKQASEKFDVSVATISRWEKLGELYGKNLAMYEELKGVTA